MWDLYTFRPWMPCTRCECPSFFSMRPMFMWHDCMSARSFFRLTCAAPCMDTAAASLIRALCPSRCETFIQHPPFEGSLAGHCTCASICHMNHHHTYAETHMDCNPADQPHNALLHRGLWAELEWGHVLGRRIHHRQAEDQQHRHVRPKSLFHTAHHQTLRLQRRHLPPLLPAFHQPCHRPLHWGGPLRVGLLPQSCEIQKGK